MSFTASDVLLKAASIVEEEGRWCQGQMYSGQQRCALGAISEANHELGVGFLRTQAVLETYLYSLNLVPSGNPHLCPVAAWNDAPGRTADEVAEAMRRAAL